MSRSCLISPLVGVVVLLCQLPLSAQPVVTDLHEFTDKAGKTILAELLAVSDDRKTMRIRREDGQVFESEIVALCLDDQQFVKDWMKTRPADAVIPDGADYRLEIEIARKATGTDRHRYGSYELEQKMQTFDVTVTNLSREALSGARVEYVIVWWNALDVFFDEDDGEWSARYRSSNSDELERDRRTAITASAPISEIAFNREDTITTTEHELNRMMYSSEVYREDEFHGIIARVIDASGRVLAEERTGAAAIDTIEWEEAMALVPRPEVDDD